MDRCTSKPYSSSKVAFYSQLERRCRSKYERVCINGKTTGCGNCVGFCTYTGHPGFLTEKLRADHDCIAKGCFYYVAKPVKSRTKKDLCSFENDLLGAAKAMSADMEGLRILRSIHAGDNEWELHYISISSEYSLSTVASTLETRLGCKITPIQLNYSFDRCVQLILTG